MATHDYSNASDQDIVNLARQGDPAALRELVRRFQPVVYSLVLRIVGRTDAAEDVMQEILLGLFDALEKEGPTRNPGAWIRAVAHNATINYVNRIRPDAQYKPRNLAPATIPLAAPSDTPVPELDPDEFDKALRRAIRRLPLKERECARLFFQKEWTHAKIAERLNWPLGTVKTTIRRIRRELQEPLGPWNDLLNGD